MSGGTRHARFADRGPSVALLARDIVGMAILESERDAVPIIWPQTVRSRTGALVPRRRWPLRARGSSPETICRGRGDLAAHRGSA